MFLCVLFSVLFQTLSLVEDAVLALFVPNMSLAKDLTQLLILVLDDPEDVELGWGGNGDELVAASAPR